MNRKMYWGIAALLILIIAGVSYMFAVQYAEIRQLKKGLAEAEKLEQSTKQPIDYTKPPPGKTFANGGHWHNGEWHDEPHEPHEGFIFIDPHEQARLQRQTETKAGEDKRIAAYAAAKTAREKNLIYMNELKNYPAMIDEYNFYKEYPDFDPDTASQELYAKWRAAVRAKHAKMRAYADEITALHKELHKNTDMSPRIGGPIGNKRDDESRPDRRDEEGGDE